MNISLFDNRGVWLGMGFLLHVVLLFIVCLVAKGCEQQPCLPSVSVGDVEVDVTFFDFDDD